MAVPKRTIRGLQDLRTHSGTVEQVASPYRAYMRISCLEMEKFRRGQERKSAMHRVENIDARFEEIEAEKAAILKMTDDTKTRQAIGAPRRETKTSTGHSKGGFKIRY
jgi:hypothetical protein